MRMSVSCELHAIAATQPCALKRAAATRPIFDADGQTEDVTADGICHFDCGGGIGQVAGVVRGAEVVEDDFVERCTRCCTQAPTPL